MRILLSNEVRGGNMHWMHALSKRIVLVILFFAERLKLTISAFEVCVGEWLAVKSTGHAL